mmetsp:Transcript_8002/g.4223  ORF Transcript_8002/g.4223 Transcript_8002/m.4223 type:complete len:262 (+) Transcript_8002:2807-3592(+)
MSYNLQLSGYIGRKTIGLVNHILELLSFFYKVLQILFKMRRQHNALVKKEIIEQLYQAGIKTLPIIIFVALISGSMLVFQFIKVSGNYNIGRITFILICREIGPIFTALMIIMCSAASMTLEIKYMNDSGKIDYIEKAGVNPIMVLCLPRVIGITSAILCLTAVFNTAALVGGYAVVQVLTQIQLDIFLEQIGSVLNLTDIIAGFIKAFCFGVIISMTSLFYGFETKLIRQKTFTTASQAALECFLYCMLANIIISFIFYI